MRTERPRHIFITLALAVLLTITSGFSVPPNGASPAVAAASGSEKADPEITYSIPKGLNLTYDHFYLNARTTNCDAVLSYSVADPPCPEHDSPCCRIDQDGKFTILHHDHEFGTTVRISVPETETTKAKWFDVWVDVHYAPQTIHCKDTYKTTLGKPVTIDAQAIGKLTFKSGDSSIAKVSSTGKVTFIHPGTVTIRVKADYTGPYWVARKNVKVTCRMTAPKLKVTSPRSRCAKLTWSKVGGAQKYIIYVKYPGKKKYKPVTIRSNKVKSVTHKRLKKGKKFSYKVRACLVCEDGVFYGPYSKARTVRVK